MYTKISFSEQAEMWQRRGVYVKSLTPGNTDKPAVTDHGFPNRFSQTLDTNTLFFHILCIFRINCASKKWEYGTFNTMDCFADGEMMQLKNFKTCI